ncbi:MAG: hypothetical protein Q9227_001190 [Pyrenula ochraceoflavens]
MTASLNFYVDALGMDILVDTQTNGSWRSLFGADSDSAHGVYLGDASSVNNGSDGVVELIQFNNPLIAAPASVNYPETGFFLVSFWVGDQWQPILDRLAAMGLGGTPKVANFGNAPNPPTNYATVRDPDGTQILLAELSYINAVGTSTLDPDLGHKRRSLTARHY